MNNNTWHVVGALAHCAPLIAAFSSFAVFAAMGAGVIVWLPILFHLTFLCLETIATFYPNTRNQTMTQATQ